jgi:hypothetical protein
MFSLTSLVLKDFGFVDLITLFQICCHIFVLFQIFCQFFFVLGTKTL